MPRRSESVTQLTSEQIRCHLYRHNYSEPGIFLERHVDGDVWVLRHECRSCCVRRNDYCAPETLQLLWRDYDYTQADNYPMACPVTAEDFRRELVSRLRLRVVQSA